LYAIVSPLKTDIVGSTGKALWMLIAAAGLVLLIVCANLANLLLTKNSKRVREVALRSVCGAGHWCLARQFLTETLVLASAGGASAGWPSDWRDSSVCDAPAGVLAACSKFAPRGACESVDG